MGILSFDRSQKSGSEHNLGIGVNKVLMKSYCGNFPFPEYKKTLLGDPKRFKLNMVTILVDTSIEKGGIMTPMFIDVLDIVFDAFCALSHLFLKAVIGKRFTDVCDCFDTDPKERWMVD